MAVCRNVALGLMMALCAWAPLLAQSASAFEQTAPSGSAPTPKQFVEERLAVWQQRLSLQDWTISIAMKRLADFPPKTLGGIRWDKSKKTAVIWVVDAADYQLPYQAMLEDMELTVVHELVHLDLTALPHGQASRGSEEHAVDGIAQAMLLLDRRKN